MNNYKIAWIFLVGAFLAISPALKASDFDSSAPLPAMTAAALATKTAGKAYGDYQALRKRENEIFAVLMSPDFERKPRREREVERAGYLVELGKISRQQNAQLNTYKVYLSNAMAAFGEVGPGQMGAAQTHLENIRAAMIKDIGQRTVTAGALASAARLGGLSPQQRRQFKNYAKQLERKQAMEERFRESGQELANATLTVESVISYMDDVKNEIDIAIAETEANIALNTGAKAVHIVKEMSYQLCGEKECSPEKMFSNGPDHSKLMGDFGTEPSDPAEDEKTTEEYINKYSRR